MALFFGAFGQFFDANGDPLSGAKLYFYEGGTTTPRDTYPTYALTNPPNSNPVVADSAGRFGAIWLLNTGSYKAVLTTPADVVIWTADYISGAATEILTTRGDLLTRDATGYKRLALGTNGQALLSDGTDAVWGNVPSLTAENTWTQSQTIYSNDAGAGAGPFLSLYRDSASPAANDMIGGLLAYGNDSGGNITQYGYVGYEILDPTNGSEDSRFVLGTMVAGVDTAQIWLSNGAVIGAATGGAQGTGTVNATNFYKNGTPMAFQTSYDSGEQAITAAGALNLSHSLGAKPSIVTASLICKTAEAGYSIGDEVLTAVGGFNTDNGVACRITTTQLQLRYGSDSTTFRLPHFTTGALTTLTNANWRLRLRAFV